MSSPSTTGGVHYHPFPAVGIEVKSGRRLVSPTLWGVRDVDDRDDPDALVDFVTLGHDGARDSFYEMKIPLALLGLDRAGLEAAGLGVLLGQGETSCLDTIPNDPATLDTPGTTPSNSPAEWEDADAFTVPFARVAAR